MESVCVCVCVCVGGVYGGCVCVCPAMRFVMLWGIELKVGMGYKQMVCTGAETGANITPLLFCLLQKVHFSVEKVSVKITVDG